MPMRSRLVLCGAPRRAICLPPLNRAGEGCVRHSLQSRSHSRSLAPPPSLEARTGQATNATDKSRPASLQPGLGLMTTKRPFLRHPDPWRSGSRALAPVLESLRFVISKPAFATSSDALQVGRPARPLALGPLPQRERTHDCRRRCAPFEVFKKLRNDHAGLNDLHQRRNRRLELLIAPPAHQLVLVHDLDVRLRLLIL